MKRLLYLLPLPVLVAGLAFARRPNALSRPATETAEAFAKSLAPATGAASDLRYSFATHSTLLYRFDSTGEVEVAPPADSRKAPAGGRFHLTGVLAVRATDVRDDGSADLEIQFRDVKAESGDQKGAARLQGAVATVKIDARGQMHAVEAEDGAAVFLRHFELVLPPLAGDTAWEVSGRDPAGEYTARYLLDGRFTDGSRPVARMSIARAYAKPTSRLAVAGSREYKAVAHFDAARGCIATIDVTGAVAGVKDGPVALAGSTRITFALADVVSGKFAPQPRAEIAAKPAKAEPKKLEPKKESLDQLAAHLRAGDTMTRSSAALRLASVRTPEARALAVDALKDPEFLVRGNAAVALGSWTDEETAKILANALRTDPADVVRLRAAQSLEGTPCPEARQALAKAASDDKSAYVRQVASESLVVKGASK